jgi:PIN domain nuclease of toxin-antitoxin system
VKPLLDTHILLFWLANSPRLKEGRREVVESADADHPLFLSDISLWEIATLHELGRISLDRPLRDWLEIATAPPLVQRVGITPAIAGEVAALPPHIHRDPADRIIIATARVLGYSLVTLDRRIIDAAVVATVS